MERAYACNISFERGLRPDAATEPDVVALFRDPLPRGPAASGARGPLTRRPVDLWTRGPLGPFTRGPADLCAFSTAPAAEHFCCWPEFSR